MNGRLSNGSADRQSKCGLRGKSLNLQSADLSVAVC
jgi:hypothetical protein